MSARSEGSDTAAMREQDYRTHLTRWAMLAGPLILTRDLRDVTVAVDTVLHNADLVAIAQDPLAIQGRKVCQIDDVDIWSRPLRDGATALAFFSRERRKAPIQVRWSELGLPDQQDVRDVWKQSGLGQFNYTWRATLPAYGAGLLKLSTVPRSIP